MKLSKRWLYGSMGFLSLLGLIGIFTEERGFLAFFAFAVDFEFFFLPSDEMVDSYMTRSAARGFFCGMLSVAVVALAAFFWTGRDGGEALAAAFSAVNESTWEHMKLLFFPMLPKSITTAIGMGVSQELGGDVTITVAVIIVTGVLGNICAESVCRIFRITHPVAKGIAIGPSAHAIGTAKAMEMGEIEGAMSSLSIVIAGICTMVGASFFAGLY